MPAYISFLRLFSCSCALLGAGMLHASGLQDVYKRQEEYVQDDVALNRKLIELAVNDVTLRFADGSRSFSPEELSACLLYTSRCV